ncbi:unnamed protein product [Orchesella dallaii]|uniref:Mid2 domain-containing protein n=1 Tax=Orchesella dallaii TaxID=48710 RepID=A0ABP1QPL3_9HEXA
MFSRSRSASATSAAISLLMVFADLSQVQMNPLVYPNRYSFHKTTTTSTTLIPLPDHDHSNSTLTTESGDSSLKNNVFSYWIVGFVVGALIILGILYYVLCIKKRRQGLLSSYTIRSPDDNKADFDSSQVMVRSSA